MSLFSAVTGLALVAVGIAGLISSIGKAFSYSRLKPNPVMAEVERRLTESQPPLQRGVPSRAEGVAQPMTAIADQRSKQGMEGKERERTSGEQQSARTVAEAEANAERTEQEKRYAAEQERRRAIQDSLVEATRLQETEWKRQAAENQAAKALAERDRAEMKLREGIRPVLMPTLNEFKETKKTLEYKEGWFHFAVVGIAGTGKSSLVNALRGLRNNRRGAAQTGTSETTRIVTRYADASDRPFVWYDVPGAGTVNVPDWKYFVDQGLYIFDAIIVLYGDRFTETDIAILRNCSRWKIPAYIVRSKAGVHIKNTISDFLDEDDDEDEPQSYLLSVFRGQASPQYMEAMSRARGRYIKNTREDVERNLAQAGLLQQRVYIVDKDALTTVVRGKEHPDLIDEQELYRDLLAEAASRRIVPE
ncbi:interferon-inducible GTPase-domain-containing protein [Fomitopsis betulina]|nr:interferon-inducible GTPase-domain-containing protein [Fomitopsis betulina]